MSVLKFFRAKSKDSAKFRSGFSLIEMLVTIGILSMILSITNTYSRTGEKQIILFKDQAKLIQAFQRAKSLGLSAFGIEGAACGYGVHIDKQAKTFIVFKDLPANAGGECSLADNKFNGDVASCGNVGNECVEKYSLDSKVLFTEGTTLTDIIFIPPDPIVMLSPDAPSAIITINAVGSNFTKSIQVNNAGQISTYEEAK